jgi:hypothetical protein
VRRKKKAKGNSYEGGAGSLLSLLVALLTLQHDTKLAAPPLWGYDPGPQLPGRAMAHVLGVAAFQIGHPVACFIQMKADNPLLHDDASLARLNQAFRLPCELPD